MAAASPHRPSRSRLDHGGLARRGLCPGHPCRVLPLGGAGAAGLLRPAHGATARRVHARPDALRGPRQRARRAGRAGGPRAHRPAHGRCRRPGPEVAVVGAPDVEPGRCPRGRRVPVGTGRHRGRATTTAIARGSSATPGSTSRPEVVSALRDRVAGIRKRPGGPSTSTAAAVAATFGVAAMADQAIAQQGDRYARSRA